MSKKVKNANMKIVDVMPTLLNAAYVDYVDIEKQIKELNIQKTRKKKHILAFLKMEQTKGIIYKGKKIISSVDKAPPKKINTVLFKEKNSSLYNECLGYGTASTALSVIEDERLTKKK